MEAGADEFAWKPVDFADLYNKIAKFFASYEAAPTHEESPPPTGIEQLPFTLIDAKTGLELWLDARVYRKALLRFGREYGDCVARVQAIVDAGDPMPGVELLHAFRGVAANLGIHRLATLGNTLEQVFKAGGRPDAAQIAALEDAMLDFETDLNLLTRAGDDAVQPLDDRAADSPAGVDVPAALGALDRLLAALEQSDLDDEATDALRTLLEPEQFQPLEDALDSFELEQAAELARALKHELMLKE
jgi:HPt (histidine-containing phosphotransfer) domain-containing protein